MEVDINALKKTLKRLMNSFLNNETDQIRTYRCKAAVDFLFMLKVSVIKQANRNAVVDQYRKLERIMKGEEERYRTEECLDKLESSFHNAILRPL